MIKTIRILQRYLLSCLIQLALVGVLLAGDQQRLQTVPEVNLNRYAGTWYEIARLPNWFQDHRRGTWTGAYRRPIDQCKAGSQFCIRFWLAPVLGGLLDSWSWGGKPVSTGELFPKGRKPIGG